jgi:hypothetical protein
MNYTKSSNRTLLLLLMILLAFFAGIRIFNPETKDWKNIITSDGRGYYAYLPALLIYGDPTFGKSTAAESQLLKTREYNPNYLVRSEGHTVNKYFAGPSLLMAPFFSLAYGCALFSGEPLTGYSFYFQLFTGLAALFYLFLGLLFLKKILEQFADAPQFVSLVLLAIVLATNLFYYLFWQPAMSHVYSFFAINGFLWSVQSLFLKNSVRHAALAGLFYGLVILIRPLNGIILLMVPFFIPDAITFRKTLRYLLVDKGLIVIPFFLAIVLIQPLLWKVQTGRWFIWPYAGEGFYFRRPEIANLLFSYRKGLFIYTPLAFLSLFGFFPLYIRSRFRAFWLFLFLALTVYLTSSWWNWYYGDGFGMRPLIDFFGLFAILLLSLVQAFKSKGWFNFLCILIGILAFVNLFQTWQYNHRVISPDSMNREKYRYVFLRADSAVINTLGGVSEIPYYGSSWPLPVAVYQNNLEKELRGWNNGARIVRPGVAYSSKTAGILSSAYEFSAGLHCRMDTVPGFPGQFFCEVSLMLRDSTPGAGNPAFLVASIDSFDYKHNVWYDFKLNDIPRYKAREWRMQTYSFNLPLVTNPKAVLKIYVWNPARKWFTIDDWVVVLYGRKK